MANNQSDGDFRVAIIGGGITGINLALGLQARGVRFTLYERADGFREIGAGIGFSPNAERAMAQLDPAILAAYKRVANPNSEDYFQWVDGYATGAMLYRLHVGKDGFQGCRRSDVLEAWAELLRDGQVDVRFGKQVDTISDEEDGDGPVVIRFTDGTEATADAVVGCDGIRSRVRQLVLPEGAPAARPHYSAKFCFRALVPMDRAVGAVGAYRAGTRFMYNGPGAHVITYPVGGNAVLNVLAVLSDARPWPDGARHTAPGHRDEAMRVFSEWRGADGTVPAIVGLMPDEMDKWAIFDMAEHPAPTYFRGRLAVAGDAAHATGPHLGAGAGLGIEDAAVLADLLRAVAAAWPSAGKSRRRRLVERAFDAYTRVRYDRTQAVVQWTRQACDLFHWADPAIRDDGVKFGAAITPKFHGVWEYDVEGSVRGALAKFEELAAEQ